MTVCKWCGEPLEIGRHNLRFEIWNGVRYFGVLLGLAVFLTILGLVVVGIPLAMIGR